MPSCGESQSSTHSRPVECDSKLSRLGQTIQNEYPSIQKSSKQYAPSDTSPKWTCLSAGSATSYHFCVTCSGPTGLGSGCTQPALGGSGTLYLPPSSHLPKVVEKLQDCPCSRIILITPGWPNMPWFYDLVAMSSQILLCLTCPIY